MFSSIVEDSSDEEVENLYYCIKKFEVVSSMDLPLEVGDVVNILTFDDEKYWYGCLKSDSSRRGMVPRVNIVPYDSDARVDFEKLQDDIKHNVKPSRPPRVKSVYSREAKVPENSSKRASYHADEKVVLPKNLSNFCNYDSKFQGESSTESAAASGKGFSAEPKNNNLQDVQKFVDNCDEQIDRSTPLPPLKRQENVRSELFENLDITKSTEDMKPQRPATTTVAKSSTLDPNFSKGPIRQRVNRDAMPDNSSSNVCDKNDSLSSSLDYTTNSLPNQKFISSKKNSFSLTGIKRSLSKFKRM